MKQGREKTVKASQKARNKPETSPKQAGTGSEIIGSNNKAAAFDDKSFP